MTALLTALALAAFAGNSLLCRLALAGHRIDAASFTFVRLASGGRPASDRRHAVCYLSRMVLTIELEREEDGRCIASVPELRGVHAYGATPDDAVAAAQALAFHVLADEIAHGERDARTLRTVSFVDSAA